MAKGAKLKDALEREKGVDKRAEYRKKAEKKALKRKRARESGHDESEADGGIRLPIQTDRLEDSSVKRLKVAQSPAKEKSAPADSDVEDEDSADGSEDWETAEEDIMHTGIDLSRIEDSETSDSEDDEVEGRNRAGTLAKTKGQNGHADAGAAEDEEEVEDDIPLSDIESLASEDKGDVIPHQRLTINNTSALTRALKSIALPVSLPFSATQAITSEKPTEIADIEDDLKRESAFYMQSLEAVTRARGLLKKEGIPFARPADYFAEMVKTDEHMGKVKKRLVDEAASKKASSEARKQRDLKKFGKQVQVAKLQERSKEKRETLDKIKMLKKKRSGASIGNENENDMFDIALEDSAETEKKDRAARKASGAAGANPKRQKKNDKYGFGGKKRFAKSNDATSSADTRAFSVKKMKGKTSSRPGKSKRARTRG